MSATSSRPAAAKPSGSDMNDNRVFPSASTDRGDRGSGSYDRDDAGYQRRQISRSEEEGVEVVLGGASGGNPKIVDQLSPNVRPTPDQNVFRPPRPVRPRAVRAQGGPPPPPHLQGSGSYGYGLSPSHEYGHRPYPVPYNPSGSFDEAPHPYHTQSQYSPHIQYPPPGARHPPEDVNVISPNHKGGPRRPTDASRGRAGGPPGYYHYPPTSPVSRTGGGHSPPRLRNYAMRREGPYSAAQRGRRHPEDGTWNPLPVTSGSVDRSQPPLVTESSFDSDHYSSHQSHASHPTTPSTPHTPHTPHHHGPPGHDPRHHGFYGGGSFGSFDSHAPPPPHFDDYRYYGHPPPESPYSHYSYQGYSPGGYYDHYSPHPEYGRPPHSYEEDEHYHHHHHHHGEQPNAVTPNDAKGSNAHAGMVLPKAAHEIDFDVTDPPMEPVTPPSKIPICESPADINSYDVLCGRGGGTNSQIGNRRFRKLVQEFQPTYLLARRKEKPLLARTIVLIIRKRGGRFLKKDEETGELFEVGDAKAEAKTSQALREGLDVRATKTEAKSMMDKKKKTKGGKTKDDTEADDDVEDDSPVTSPARTVGEATMPPPPESPPTLPRLQGEEKRESTTRASHSPTPESLQFRKRRRMRSGDNGSGGGGGGGGFQDKLFSEFCPPRADLGRVASPILGEPSSMDMNTPQRRNNAKYDDDDIRYEGESANSSAGCGTGCAGIALDMVTGAAAGSFCLGPRKWR